jgi:hypothetical protein
VFNTGDLIVCIGRTSIRVKLKNADVALRYVATVRQSTLGGAARCDLGSSLGYKGWARRLLAK